MKQDTGRGQPYIASSHHRLTPQLHSRQAVFLLLISISSQPTTERSTPCIFPAGLAGPHPHRSPPFPITFVRVFPRSMHPYDLYSIQLSLVSSPAFSRDPLSTSFPDNFTSTACAWFGLLSSFHQSSPAEGKGVGRAKEEALGLIISPLNKDRPETQAYILCPDSPPGLHARVQELQGGR